MLVIDYSDRRPIYEQIVERLRLLILNGALEAGEKLPSVRSLAVELSINPNTIQRAYSELERTGLIVSVKGRGNFVSSKDAPVINEQEKLLDSLRLQLKTCRESGIESGKVMGCVREIYTEVNK